jgi:hypothetical protein
MKVVLFLIVTLSRVFFGCKLFARIPDDTDSPTPDMIAQLQHELAALPALLQPSTSPTTESSDSPAHAPPTPPTDQTEPPSPNTASTWQSRPYPVTTPSNSSSPRWQQLIQDPTELDILSYSTGLPTDFQAGTLNFFGKTQALSYQKTEKQVQKQSMWPYGRDRHTRTHASNDSYEHPPR